MNAGLHRRRVGAVRPSHLMFTGGVGALIDLPNFSVLVTRHRRLDATTTAPPEPVVDEPRLLAAVQRLPGHAPVERAANGPVAGRHRRQPQRRRRRAIGVPVVPFPHWLRCTALRRAGAARRRARSPSSTTSPCRPDEAQFVHTDCPRARNKRPLAVAARFVLACIAGHLDDFPYRQFVHRGCPAPRCSSPRLRMQDRGGNLGANVEIRCMNCKAKRNIREALGETGRAEPARLPGPPPAPAAPSTHAPARSSPSCWWSAPPTSGSPRRCRALAVPTTGASELAAKVAEHWEQIEGFPRDVLAFARSAVPALLHFGAWTDDELWAAIEAHRAALAGQRRPGRGGGGYVGPADRRNGRSSPPPAIRPPRRTSPCAGRGSLAELIGLLDDVVQAERLREARALVGFTRLDAPDPEDPDVVKIAPLSRSPHPEWVPAVEVRGEGLFVRLPEPLLSGWETAVDDSPVLQAHRDAYARFRRNRYSDRITATFDEMRVLARGPATSRCTPCRTCSSAPSRWSAATARRA